MLACIERGTSVFIDDIFHTIERINEHTSQYELYTKEGRWRVLTFVEFAAMYAEKRLRLSNLVTQMPKSDGKNKKTKVVTLLTAEEQDIIDYRLGFIKAASTDDGSWNSVVADCREAIRAHAEITNDKKRVSVDTVRRWHRLLVRSKGDVTVLLPKYKRRGNRTARINAAVIEALDNVIQRKYLTKEKNTIRQVYETEFKALFETGASLEGETAPSYRTFYSRIEQLDAYEKVLARHGFHYAKNRFPSGRKVPQPTFVLERVEIDHTPIDITIVDQDGKVLKRVYATFLIDCYSRMIVGFFVSMQPVCKRNVLEAVRHAILPKDYIKTAYPFLKNEWPCFGVFALLVADNGLELHAEDVKRIIASLGIDMSWCIKKMPVLKGKIERFIKTFNFKLIQQQPGTTFSNFWQRGDYQSDHHACLTFDQLIEIIHRWIVDDYHVSVHRGLGDTPLEAWKRNAHLYPAPRLPESIDRLNSLLWEKSTRRLQKYGIDLFALKYNSEALMDIAKKHDFGISLDVYHDPSNIATVFVMVPNSDEYIEVPCTSDAYVNQGITLDEHNAIKRIIQKKQADIRHISDHLLIQARMELKRVVAEAVAKKNKSKKSRRHAMDPELHKTSSDSAGTRIQKVHQPQVFDDSKESKIRAFKPQTIGAQYAK